MNKKNLRRHCSPFVALSSPLIVVSSPLSVSACLVGCCIVVLCLVVCIVPLHCSVASPRHVALRCVASSRLVITTRFLVVSLSCLILPRRCVPPPCTSHHTHFVWLVVALSRCASSLLPLAHLGIATCHCVARCCCVVSCLIVALCLVITSHRVIFCHRVCFSWLLHFLPSASRHTASRRH